MKCVKCGSENISTQIIQTSGKVKENNRGCLWGMARFTLIICTCGLWLLVGKSKGKATIKYDSQTMAICNKCGYQWRI